MSNDKTFNLTDLTEEMAVKLSMTKPEAAAAASFTLDSIKAALIAGKQVRFHHFGTLSTKIRKGGNARNPATGQSITLPDHRLIKFTPAKSLRASVYTPNP